MKRLSHRHRVKRVTYVDFQMYGSLRKILLKWQFLLWMLTNLTELEHRVTVSVTSKLKENQIFYNQ